MEEKVTKEKSIIYNQGWILNLIENGHLDLIPYIKPDMPIGMYIEKMYATLPPDTPKITKKTSILFNREWIIKAKKEGVKIPRPSKKYSIGEKLELLYCAKELLNWRPDPEDILKLKREKVVKI